MPTSKIEGSVSGVGEPRRRNAILDVLELYQALGAPGGLVSLIAFLYLCENEGLCISELASVAGLNMAAASRAAHSLTRSAGEAGALPPTLGLVELRQTGRVRTLHLTQLGRDFRDRIDSRIRRAVTICN
jgi:hypothetical protein